MEIGYKGIGHQSSEEERNANRERSGRLVRGVYWTQRRALMYCCCICRAGETDGGGLATERVDGSTIGIALRLRWASGWWSFV